MADTCRWKHKGNWCQYSHGNAGEKANAQPAPGCSDPMVLIDYEQEILMNMTRFLLFVGPVLVMGSLLAMLDAEAHSPPADAKVYFVNLQDGAVVESPFEVEFGIEGFGITPAGTKGKIRHKAGHHHLLIDVENLPSMDEPIPQDSQHVHFDQGETQAVLELPSGKHTLQLLLGDEDHEPQDPPLISEKITIIVN